MYAVPYMICANYDAPYENCKMDTSASYLGALLLTYAGDSLYGFFARKNFLIKMISNYSLSRKDVYGIGALGRGTQH